MEHLPLSARTCVACRPGTPPLPPDQVQALLAETPGWTVDGTRLRRVYRFSDFAGGLAFVNRIGKVADEQDHHPDVLLAWGRVELTLWTHAAGGLTENDFILAAKIDLLGLDAHAGRDASS